MSFSWKGLLGVGGAGGAGSNVTSNGPVVGGLAGPADPLAGINGWDEKDVHFEIDDIADLPNMLGMQNFGNTCYVNSVIQALYYCKPFRESLMAYSSSLSSEQDGGTHTRSATGTTATLPLQSDEVTFFDALKRLFSQMLSATVSSTSSSEQTSTPATASYLASGLSRKSSVRPTPSTQKAGLSNPASTSLSVVSGPATVLPAGNKSVNACSNVVVQDDDIKTFLTTLKKSNVLFDSTAQQDAHELLNFILNRIGEDVVEETKGKERRTASGADDSCPVSVLDVEAGGRTWVHRVFEGVLTNETRCLTCETVTSRDESFLDLSIDIERNSSVTSCLRQFSASEMLCARNKFFCDTCSGLQEAEKRMKVKKLPNVLALHLKRFKYEEAVQKYVKLAYRVVFPFELRLFNTSDDAEDAGKLYELFGIIVHIGVGPHHGHYIAIVKVGLRWFVFDDETINVIDQADICRYFGDTPGAGSAYVLFYQAVELDMQSLGLVDTREQRQRAREKMEEDLWEQYSQRAAGSTGTLAGVAAKGAAEGAGVRVDTAKLPISPASQPSPTSSDSMAASELKSAAMMPSSSSSSATTTFFNRKQSNSNVGSSQAVSYGEPSDAKGGSSSWFNSLRPSSSRKAAGGGLLSVAGTNSTANAVISPPSSFKPPPGAGATGDQAEDCETASVSTSGSSKRANAPKEVRHDEPPLPVSKSMHVGEGSGLLSPEPPSSLPSSLQSSPSKMAKLPAAFQQGATWAPADRPLSKKEQEKIAKHSRRSSLSASHSIPPPPPIPSLPMPNGGAVQNSLGIGHPFGADSGANGSGGGNFASVGRKPTLRRPSTADPQMDQSPATRRRSTLSKTFGFGRKAEKS